MDCISHLGEPLDVFERQLLHFARNQTPLCLKNVLFSPHLPGRHDGKSH
jgi:hypothetical protein